MSDAEVVPDYPGRLRLDGRVVVVLGAGAGIGRQTSHALAQAGATVVCVGRRAEPVEAVAEEIGGHAVTGDVVRHEGMEHVLAEAGRIGPVTGLVDIVGMALPGPVLSYDEDRYDEQFDVVLRHAFLALRIGGRAIAEAGGGSMVFIGSVSGQAYVPGQTIYGAAKAALHRMVESAGRELAPLGVRVNAVAPGFTHTPRLDDLLTEDRWAAIDASIPRGRAGFAAEIAGPVLFLMSDLATYLTGQTVAVDGGMSASVPVRL
ncbi:SDR family NAD(P)-dependent oxidoreductase [Pseudonocardia xinjiangensis]|uniref:SDR family NAD(P)-dependent oxidoreductase n=1 Tax=Pseudonocardia xinjiangensis TaxID=75289 RepID=UPI003D90E4ED